MSALPQKRTRAAQHPMPLWTKSGHAASKCPSSAALVDGHHRFRQLLMETGSFLRRQLVRFENYNKSLEATGECERHFAGVILSNWRSCVCANIERFIQRETRDCRLRNLPLRNLLFVHE